MTKVNPIQLSEFVTQIIRPDCSVKGKLEKIIM